MYQFLHKQHVKVFAETQDEAAGIPPVIQFATTCCAFSVISAQNCHSVEQLGDVLQTLRKDSDKKNWKPEDRTGGERTFAVFTTPQEAGLEANLIEVGFRCVASNLPRRKGYPPGKLKMFLYSL